MIIWFDDLQPSPPSLKTSSSVDCLAWTNSETYFSKSLYAEPFPRTCRDACGNTSTYTTEYICRISGIVGRRRALSQPQRLDDTQQESLFHRPTCLPVTGLMPRGKGVKCSSRRAMPHFGAILHLSLRSSCTLKRLVNCRLSYLCTPQSNKSPVMFQPLFEKAEKRKPDQWATTFTTLLPLVVICTRRENHDNAGDMSGNSLDRGTSRRV